jgi:hypothetical protein
MGGAYSNTVDREIEIEIANDLCNNALFESTKDTIRLMPPEYYTLSSSSKIKIPAGKINGNIEVQLTDDFFNDSLAIKLGYVIPIRIVSATNLDSVLQGKPDVIDPDQRIDANWAVIPKDFTMFAVNYINPYHGTYLRRGISTIDSLSTPVETNIYRKNYMEQNELLNLTTTGKNQVTLQSSAHSQRISKPLIMNLVFSENGNCTVSQSEGSEYTISGTGKFMVDGDEWGNAKRDVIHLQYQLISGSYSLTANDTLVIRDRNVKLQVYKPVVFSN